jgi:hypothetical protein
VDGENQAESVVARGRTQPFTTMTKDASPVKLKPQFSSALHVIATF